MKRLFFVFLVATVLMVPKSSFSQDSRVDSIQVLQLFNVQKGKSKMIFVDEKIIYRVKSDGGKKNHKGYVEYIGPDGIVVDGSTVKVDDLLMVMNKTHRKTIRFTGGTTILGGAIVAISGASLVMLEQGGLAPYVGIAGLATGIPAIIAGVIPFTHSNHFSRKKGWKPLVITLPVLTDEEDL